MRLHLEGGEYHADPHNAFILKYDNDLLNGLYVDLDEEYIFVPQHVRDYVKKEIEQRAAEEGIETAKVKGTVDLTEPPHCYVVASLGRTIASAAENIANGY